MPEKIYQFYYYFGTKGLTGWTLEVDRTTPKMLCGTIRGKHNEKVGNFTCKEEDLGVVKMLSFSGEKYLRVTLEGDSYNHAKRNAAVAIMNMLHTMADELYQDCAGSDATEEKEGGNHG